MTAPEDALPRVTAAIPLPYTLRGVWGTSLLACLAMFVLASIRIHAGVTRVAWDPLGDPRFGDLTEYLPTFKLLHTAAFWGNPITSPVAYPPFAAVLFALLYGTGHVVRVYVLLAAVALGFALWRTAVCLRGLRLSWRVAALLPGSMLIAGFPTEGLLQRGNIELLLWLFAGLGTWAWLRKNDYAAAVLWGLAAAVKLYPIIYLALLLPRRRYAAFACGLATFTVSTFGSMLFLGPTLAQAWHGSIHNVFGYQGVRVSEWSMHELATNHSVFGLLKVTARLLHLPMNQLTLPYYCAGAVLFAMLFFGRVQRMPKVNQLMMVSLFMVMLPPISYFYTLVHLYAPFLLLLLLQVRCQLAGAHVAGLRPVLFLFLPVFACFTLFNFRSVLLFGGLAQAVLLSVLFFCSVQYPFGDAAEW